MDEQEKSQLYEQLQQLLSEQGLNWINDQVNEYVQSGKVIIKDVHIYKEIDEERKSNIGTYRASRKTQRMLGVEPYSIDEQLVILLGAIEKALTDVDAMRDEIVNFFNQQLTEQQHLYIEIVSDQIEDERKMSFSLAEQRRTNDTQYLQSLIAQLRSQIT